MMQLDYDERGDAAFVYLDGPLMPGSVDGTERLDADRFIKIDVDDRILAYEFLNVRRYGVRLDDLEHRDALRALFREAGFVERDWGHPIPTRRLDAPPPKTAAIIERWRRKRDASGRARDEASTPT
jgi:uncharacterized protein YuzE